MENKKNNLILYVGIFILILLFVIFLLISKEEEQNTFIKENVIKSETFQDKKDTETEIVNTGSLTDKEIEKIQEKEKIEEKNYGQIASILRTICFAYGDVKTIVNSQTFGLLKSEIEKISKNLDTSKDNFTFAVLPGMVLENCSNHDEGTINNIVEILQNDGNEIILSTKEEINGMYSFVDNIEFVGNNIDKNKIKESKEYFDKLFFVENFKQITSMYYFQNMYYHGNLSKYINAAALLTPEEAKKVTNSTALKFESFIKELGFIDFNDFSKKILSFNGYSNIEELKNDLLEKYDKLNKISKQELGFYIHDQVLTLDSLKNFYEGENFEKIKNNEEAYNIFKDIGNKYIYFTIVNGQYADNLGENWGGKVFFGDTLKGNGIIRLAYIYVYNNNLTK